MIILRRDFLAQGALAFGWIVTRGRCLAWLTQDDDLAIVQSVEARAKQAGIAPLLVSRTQRYLAIGDASEQFQATALRLCEGLATDFIKHFQDRKFAIESPRQRMVTVILSNADVFASFLGENPGNEVRGIYDVDADWLAFCDNREGRGDPVAERANTVSLFHEATHQLCFHTGLLDRKGDIPLAVSEGLAMYGEVRTPDGRSRIGSMNAFRRDVVRGQFDRNGRLRGQLIPVERLIAEDALLNQPDTEQLAYAQSWAFIHMFMQTKEQQAKLKAYLEAIKPRRDAQERRNDAAQHLGAFGALDEALKRYLSRIAKR